MPGEPPRTSMCSDATSGKWNTVQPVGPSAYSATPISIPMKSTSSQRFASISVIGFGCVVSLLGCGMATLRRERVADRAIGGDAYRDRGEHLGREHRVRVREIGDRCLAHDMRVARDLFLAHREADVVRGDLLRHVAEVGRGERE